MNNAEKLARPILKASKEQGNVISHEYEGGLTKREAFAMAALESGMSPTNTHDIEETAAWCVKQADALLKELED